jgi:cytochrome c oxidase subunit 2
MQNTSWVPLFPEQASTFAWQVDALYFYLIAVSVAFSIPIVLGVFYFFIKYREREKYATPDEIHGSVALETAWSIIPFVVSMTIFLGGAIVYYNQYRIPKENVMEVYVVGKQWMWKFQHGTGQREINELHVPVNRKIKLTMTTEDVLHDVFIPAFRTKADVVPGRYTTIWFEPTKPGKYHLYCAEYCGLNHSGMGGWVYVMEQQEFDNWLSGNTSNQTPVEAGRELFETKLGCASCHAAGSGQRGPNLAGVFGTDQKLTNGQVVKADEEYVRNSILNVLSGKFVSRRAMAVWIRWMDVDSSGSRNPDASPIETTFLTQGCLRTPALKRRKFGSDNGSPSRSELRLFRASSSPRCSLQ